MAKKVPCGGCGELRWPSTHAGAPVVPTCRKCRASDVQHGKSSTYKTRGCRCDLCREAWNAECRKYQSAHRPRLVRECIVCAAEFGPRSNQITCSPPCRKVHLGRLGDHHSRAEFFGVEYEQIDRLEVFERDGWVCGICELPVDRTETFPAPGSATLDHVTPMSRGGGHVLSNVQLAHFYCNTVKGNREEAAAC